MTDIAEKNLEELNNLAITQVKSLGVSTLELTLNDGQSCRAGTLFIESHKFDPKKKITRVECIIYKNEDDICRINFYSGAEILAALGGIDVHVKN